MFYPGCDLKYRMIFLAERRRRLKRVLSVAGVAVLLAAGVFLINKGVKAMPKLDHVSMSDGTHARLTERIKQEASAGVSTTDAIEVVLVAGLDALEGGRAKTKKVKK